MSATSSDPFYWADWRSDEGLRMCSAAARGVWFECLCLCAASKRKGYLLIKGVKPTVEELATAISIPVDITTAALAELQKWEVFSRDRNGIVYSRKMVRDAKKRAASAKGGKIGGRVSAEKHTGIHATRGGTPDATRKVTRHPKARTSSFSSSSSFCSVPKGTGAPSAPELFDEGSPKRVNGSHHAPAKPDLNKQVYDRGKEVFGSSAGGIITNILKAKENKYAKALALIEDAAEKRDPVSWINAWLFQHGPPGIEVGLMEPTL